MGLVIVGSEIESGLSNFSKQLDDEQAKISSLLEQISSLAGDTVLQGEAYQAVKFYFITQLYPNFARFQKACSLMKESNQEILNSFHNNGFDGGTVLKEDELKEKLQSLRASVTRMENVIYEVSNQLNYVSNFFQRKELEFNQYNYNKLLSELQSEIKEIESKLERLYAFNGTSGKYDNAVTVFSEATQAISRFENINLSGVCSYMSRIRLQVDPSQYSMVLKDIQSEIETKGYSIWELHTKEVYLDSLMANGAYNREAYQSALDKAIQDAGGLGSRNAVVAAATFFALQFPRLHYFWGGKSYNSSSDGYLGSQNSGVGINPDWGIPTIVASEGSESTGTYVNLGMDCSGFVAWALQTGGCTNPENPLEPSYIGAYDQAHNMGGEFVAIGQEGYDPSRVQPGDIVYTDGHIGMVIDRNDTKMVYAHSAGSSDGTSVDIADLQTGACLTRDGEKYFDYIVYMDNYYQTYGKN